MGLYTETIKRRVAQDEEAVQKADAALFGGLSANQDACGRAEGLRHILRYILNAYGLLAGNEYDTDDPDEMLEYTLEPCGILYEKIDMTDPGWKDSTDFVIGFLEDGSPILITNALLGHSFLRPGDHKKRHLTGRVRLGPVGYAVYRPLDRRGVGFSGFLKYTLKIVPPKFWAVICILSALSAVLNLTAPSISHTVLKEYVPAGSTALPLIVSAIFIYAAAGLIRCFLNAVKKYTVDLYKLRITKQSQISMIARVLSLPVSFFRKNQTGRVATYVRNARTLSEIIVEMVFCTSVTLVFSLVNIPQMIHMSGPLALAGLLLTAFQLLWIGISERLNANVLKMEMEADSELRNNIFSTVQGIQKIKTAGAEKRVYVKWASIFKKRLEYSFDLPLIVKLKGIFVPTLSVAVFYITAWYCHVPAADFIAFSASYAIMSAAVLEATDLFTASFRASEYVRHISKLFAADAEISQDQKILRKIRGSVKLENVNFSYNPSDAFSIEGMNFAVAPGEIIGITGRSGCGKSTLLSMIVGIIRPLSGTVYLDDHPIETLNMRFVNRRIGFLTQYSSLMPGSVRYNITLGNDDISDEEVWEALKKAQIADVISSLPDGLDSIISETMSGGFSGGQKQCMLLARAFVRKPALLILDEATSALDNNTQAAVLEEICNTKATVIMVAHRLSTIKNCDRIIVMEDGGIVEEGTYTQLMDRHGLFEKLVNTAL